MSAWVVPGYTEDRELGHGASARVVAATHNVSGRPVAIKYLAPRLLRDPSLLARFREEVGLLASIDVPHVVRLFDYVEEPGAGAVVARISTCTGECSCSTGWKQAKLCDASPSSAATRGGSSSRHCSVA